MFTLLDAMLILMCGFNTSFPWWLWTIAVFNALFGNISRSKEIKVYKKYLGE